MLIIAIISFVIANALDYVIQANAWKGWWIPYVLQFDAPKWWGPLDAIPHDSGHVTLWAYRSTLGLGYFLVARSGSGLLFTGWEGAIVLAVAIYVVTRFLTFTLTYNFQKWLRK